MAHPQQQPQAGFFDPWAPPPGFAEPPADTTHADRIKLLAKYAAQNGPTFIDTVATKQAGNPEYAFLEPGGEGHEFYRWALYCQLYGLPVDQPAPQQPAASNAPIGPAPPTAATAAPAPAAHASSAMDVDDAAAAPAAAPDAQAGPAAGYEASAVAVLEAHAREVAALPPEVAQGFAQVLSSLTGSKESIKNSQAWFLACKAYSAGMARMMADHAMAAPTFDAKLHVLYLANDILFKALAQRPQAAAQADGTAATAQASDEVSRAFAPVLGAMLAASLGSPDAPADARERMAKMLSFWCERGVFSSSVTEGMQQAMDGKDARAALVAASTKCAPTTAAAAGGASATMATAAVPVASSSAAGQPGVGAPNPWLQHPHVPGAAVAAWPHAAVPGAAYAGHVAHPAYAWPQPQVQPHPAVETEDQNDQTSQATAAGVKQEQQVQQPYPGAMPYAPMPAAGWYIDPATGAAMPYVPAQPYPGVMPVPGAYPAQQWAMQHAQQQQWAHYTQQQQQQQHGQQLPAQQDAQQQDIKQKQNVKQEQQQQQHEQDAATSAFAFPPGLIPQLVWDKARHSETYSPLSPLDIEDAGLPPPPEKDAYLRARLERFHAEIRDWRPGTTRADFEERREKEALAAGRELSDEDLPGGSLARRRKRPEEGTSLFMPVDPETGMRADGSFAGPRMGGPSYAGLGSRPRPRAAGNSGGEGDMYNSYRSMRSGAYHEMILESLAKGNAHSNLSRGGRR